MLLKNYINKNTLFVFALESEVNAGVDYHKEVKENVFNDILLDLIYDAKLY